MFERGHQMDNQLSIQEKKPFRKNITRGKVIKYLIIILFSGLVISTSAIIHVFGPYKGKIVELKTGEPIEGAAVFIEFWTRGPFAVGAYADSVEVATDERGEFKIPYQLSLTFHPLSKWEPDGHITIFKPGYGAYPGQNDVTPMFVPNGTIPEKQYVIFKLPRLETLEERRKNRWGVNPSGDVPERKYKYLLKLIHEEDANVGLTH
jgi:hypothetical protein